MWTIKIRRKSCKISFFLFLILEGEGIANYVSKLMNYDNYFRLEGVPISEHESRWKKLHLPETKEEAQRLLLMADMHGKSYSFII